VQHRLARREPAPDFRNWAAIADPARRLGAALDELYAYYRSTERMRTNLLRDINVIPAKFRPGIAAFPPTAVEVLEAGWPALSVARFRHAAIGHGVGFETWRSLTNEGLTDEEAAGLMVQFVACIGPEDGKS
jgi:hypothetical protein